MASFSILSWNVEHFKGGTARLRKVVKHIRDQDPDVFGIFEVENINLISLMEDHFQEYDFNITDGPQRMETIVAHKRNKFSQVAFTQKREFKAYNPALRPGALLSVRFNNQFYNVLFLHTDSGTGAPDFGNRQEMFGKITKLKKAVDKLADNSNGRLIALGDFNTMGLLFPSRRRADLRVSASDEIVALDRAGNKVNMSLLAKDHDLTFNNGSLQSDLDHVMASDNLQMSSLVEVRGWIQLSGLARKKFINEISDHCSLFVSSVQ